MVLQNLIKLDLIDHHKWYDCGETEDSEQSSIRKEACGIKRQEGSLRYSTRSFVYSVSEEEQGSKCLVGTSSKEDCCNLSVSMSVELPKWEKIVC